DRPVPDCAAHHPATMQLSHLFRNSCRAAAGDAGVARGICESGPTNEKGPTFVGPVSGLTPSANRPDPDGPGGLGAEASGTERTGPTQDFLVASQRGGRLAEVGQQ